MKNRRSSIVQLVSHGVNVTDQVKYWYAFKVGVCMKLISVEAQSSDPLDVYNMSTVFDVLDGENDDIFNPLINLN